MGGFMQALAAYPTAVYTVLLAVVTVYWLMALLGLVDFESSDVDLDLRLDAEAGTGEVPDLGTLSGYVVAFGLSGVPFSIVVSLLVLVAWTLSCLAGMWVVPLAPTALLRFVAGSAVLVTSAVAAVPVAAAVVRPLRKLFVHHTAIGNASLVGQQCRVLTQSVDERLGRAEVARRGASLNIRVRAFTPNALSRGKTARILEYDPASGSYLIEAEP